MKVDFLIAGVQKGGTTALWHFLRQHPNICMAEKKEIHFFDDETVDWSNPDYSIYHRQFPNFCAGQVAGEATPIYTYWPTSIARIRSYNSEIRLIISLREPVSRTYSHWKMEVSRCQEVMNFSSAIREGTTRVAEDEQSFQGCHRIFSYVERGFYAPQIRRILGHLPRKQVLFVTVDQLTADPKRLLDDVCGFLGVAAYADYPESRIIRPTQIRNDFDAINEQDRIYLQHLFSSDIAETEKLTGLDLSGWKRAVT